MKAKMIVSVFLTSIVEAEVEENGTNAGGEKLWNVTTGVHSPHIARDYSAVHVTPDSKETADKVPNLTQLMVMAVIGAHRKDIEMLLSKQVTTNTSGPEYIEGGLVDGGRKN